MEVTRRPFLAAALATPQGRRRGRSPSTPGQMHFIETLARPEGRIHFAGEPTSAWTGWMLESARRVVREVGAA